MSWFGGQDPVAELDAKIEEATSEAIPNGELDIAVGLEITDIIRSKKVPPKTAMRCLKKRLTKVYSNPNLLGSTLKLADLCVKNGGSHFLMEINSQEFVDYLIHYIFKVHYDVKDYKVYSSEAKFGVGLQILKIVKEWSMFFRSQYEGNYLDKVFHTLLNQGYDFPEVDSVITQSASNFIDSKAPPDWIDGRECMICYTPFSVMNRKHHCRACGGVFCQTHSSKTSALVSLGIMQPVRVCDDCYQIHNAKHSAEGEAEPRSITRSTTRSTTRAPVEGDDEDEQVRRAIELSLQEAQGPPSFPPPQPLRPANNSPPAAPPDEEMDEDLKAAIAASLADQKVSGYQPQASQPQQPQYSAPPQESQPSFSQQEPELEFYLNLLFDTNAYADAARYNPTQLNPFAEHNQFSQQNQQQNQFTQPSQYEKPSQYSQPSQYPEQDQYPQMKPAQHIEQHKTKLEDLTPVEEENISLFIQLLNGVRNDRAKQMGILHDQDLNDLHSKVVQLKPKLNRSLRSSIEKYEFFLEMNNKINTITRLYDEFLENKLNQAMNKHYIAQPPSFYGQYSQPDQYEPRIPQGTGASSQGTRQDKRASQVPAQGTGYSAAIPTAPVYPPNDYGAAIRQDTGLSTAPNPIHNPPYQGTMQNTGPVPQVAEQQQQATGSSRRRGSRFSSYHESLPTTPQHTGAIPYPMEDAPSLQSAPDARFDYSAQPSAPEFDNDGASVTEAEVPQYQHSFPAYEQPQYSDAGYPGAYPPEPSSPPEDEESDNESVASRYPPVGQEYERLQEAVDSGEHASTRYPALEQLEDESPLPAMPILTKHSTNESKKYKSEPEPLIEL